tara:strand:+ start:77 stop:2011 length:1935 start_codon:yes stop_codon:yes gene_type:complete
VLKALSSQVGRMQTRADKKKETEAKSIPVSEFMEKIINMKKPQFQRKRRWTNQSTGSKIPSIREFIEFLYKHKNTVHAITVGVEIRNGEEVIWAIDGNNRINALYRFIESPLTFFPEYLDEVEEQIRGLINSNLSDKFIEEVKKLNLDAFEAFQTKTFRELKDACGIIIPYNDGDDITKIINEIGQRFKNMGVSNFITGVKVNINTFKNYTKSELGHVFAEINKYSSDLTEPQILAARLCDITQFRIDDNIVRGGINDQLSIFYRKMASGEVLESHEYIDDTMNAFDFLVGFQNYLSTKCKSFIVIDNTKDKSLIFKLYELFYDIDDKNVMWQDTFTSEKINKFIKLINKSVDIINEVEKRINPVELDCIGNKSAKTANEKVENLMAGKGRVIGWFIIISGIIGSFRDNIPRDKIVEDVYKCVIYSALCNEIKNQGDKKEKSVYDIMQARDGGTNGKQKAMTVFKEPNEMCKITRSDIMSLFRMLNKESRQDTPYTTRSTSGVRTNEKRRVRRVHEMLLYKALYKYTMPSCYLDKKFENEHIITFSSKWGKDDELDIDRLGNTMPTLKNINRSRGNRHISLARKCDPSFMKFLDIIVPTNEEYDEMVEYESTGKSMIKNVIAYNTMCENNEKIYLDIFEKTMTC